MHDRISRGIPFFESKFVIGVIMIYTCTFLSTVRLIGSESPDNEISFDFQMVQGVHLC